MCWDPQQPHAPQQHPVNVSLSASHNLFPSKLLRIQTSAKQPECKSQGKVFHSSQIQQKKKTGIEKKKERTWEEALFLEPVIDVFNTWTDAAENSSTLQFARQECRVNCFDLHIWLNKLFFFFRLHNTQDVLQLGHCVRRLISQCFDSKRVRSLSDSERPGVELIGRLAGCFIATHSLAIHHLLAPLISPAKDNYTAQRCTAETSTNCYLTTRTATPGGGRETKCAGQTLALTTGCTFTNKLLRADCAGLTAHQSPQWCFSLNPHVNPDVNLH